MKIFVTIILVLSPFLALSEPTVYEASIDVEVGYASALLLSLNERLGLKLDEKEFSKATDSEHSPKSCDYDRPEEFKI